MNLHLRTTCLRTILLTGAAACLLAAGRAHADGPHKQTGPIDVSATVHGTPRIGQALTVDVHVSPQIGVSSLAVSFVPSDGIALPADTARNYGPLAAHETRTITLQVTPQGPGLQLLSVIADAGGVTEGASRRTYSIELPVDGVGSVKSQARPIVTDATGQKIESMRGVTR